MPGKGPYCLVQVFPRAHVPIAKTGSVNVQRETPWRINDVIMGSYQPASILKELPGLDELDSDLFAGKTIRQLGPAQTDHKGNDISGFFVVSDAGTAVLYNTAKDSRQWSGNARQVNAEICPSLTFIDSGNSNGGKLAVVDSTDLLKLLLTHSKMKTLAGDVFLRNMNNVNTTNNWAKSIDHTTAASGTVIDSGRGNTNRNADAMQIDSNLIKRRGYDAKQTCASADNSVPDESDAVPLCCPAPSPAGKSHAPKLLVEELQHYKYMVGRLRAGKCDVDEKLSSASGAVEAAGDALEACIDANKHLLGIINGLETEVSGLRMQLCQHRRRASVLPDGAISETSFAANCANAKQGAQSRADHGVDIAPQIGQDTPHSSAVKKRVFTHVDRTAEDRDEVTLSERKKKKVECLCPCVKFDTFFTLYKEDRLLVLCRCACIALDDAKPCVDSFVGEIADAAAPRRHAIIRLEVLVRDAIDAVFGGFVHNRVMTAGSWNPRHSRRIDHHVRIGNTILAVETDEYAHRSYKQADEIERYHDFMRTFSYRFVFIRFNPHANMEGLYSKTDLKYKLRVLMHHISIQMHRIQGGHNTGKLEIVKLFY